nr:DUF2663 family protein [Bacillus subtilis]
MESLWNQLDQFTDAPTKQMLQALVKRKQKFENYAAQCRRWRWASLICLGLLCVMIMIKSPSLSLYFKKYLAIPFIYFGCWQPLLPTALHIISRKRKKNPKLISIN